MENENLPQHFISVKRIKCRYFFIDEFNVPLETIFKVEFNHNLMVDAKSDLIFFDLKAWYSLPNQDNSNRIVMECVVQNIFEVSNLSAFIQPAGNVLLPNRLLITLTGMVITHSRAVIALNTAGTPFQDTLLPVVDPVEATKAFFKNIPNVESPVDSALFSVSGVQTEPTVTESIDLVPNYNPKKTKSKVK
jgi:hypothetical protein